MSTSDPARNVSMLLMLAGVIHLVSVALTNISAENTPAIVFGAAFILTGALGATGRRWAWMVGTLLAIVGGLGAAWAISTGHMIALSITFVVIDVMIVWFAVKALRG